PLVSIRPRSHYVQCWRTDARRRMRLAAFYGATLHRFKSADHRVRSVTGDVATGACKIDRTFGLRPSAYLSTTGGPQHSRVSSKTISYHPVHERAASICRCGRANPEATNFTRRRWTVVSDKPCLNRSLRRRLVAENIVQNRRVRAPPK